MWVSERVETTESSQVRAATKPFLLACLYERIERRKDRAWAPRTKLIPFLNPIAFAWSFSLATVKKRPIYIRLRSHVHIIRFGGGNSQ